MPTHSFLNERAHKANLGTISLFLVYIVGQSVRMFLTHGENNDEWR